MKKPIGVYIAAHFQEKAKALRDFIVEKMPPGTIKITATWLDEQFFEDNRTASEEVLQDIAARDLRDLQETDVLILISDDNGHLSQGGKHTEFGYGLARGMPLILFGPPENVFHHLGPHFVKTCPTREEVLAELFAVFQQQGD